MSLGAAAHPSAGCAWSALQVRARFVREGDAAPVNVVRMPAANGLKADIFRPCLQIEYDGPPNSTESCFCHKAANLGCRDEPCNCRYSCTHVGAGNQFVVTFPNLPARIQGCPAAMLSIPRSFIQDISKLREKCGFAQRLLLLASMLIDGYDAYQAISRGPVMQCVHQADVVSVHWLHVHTFCLGGRIDGMPNQVNALCATMVSPANATVIAERWLG